MQKYPEAKQSGLVGKWFTSRYRDKLTYWSGQVIEEVNPGAYLVQLPDTSTFIVRIEKMTGWRFFATHEEVQKALARPESLQGKGEVSNEKK